MLGGWWMDNEWAVVKTGNGPSERATPLSGGGFFFFTSWMLFDVCLAGWPLLSVSRLSDVHRYQTLASAGTFTTGLKLPPRSSFSTSLCPSLTLINPTPISSLWYDSFYSIASEWHRSLVQSPVGIYTLTCPWVGRQTPKYTQSSSLSVSRHIWTT